MVNLKKLQQLLKRFRSDESGVFAVFFGLLAVVLIATAGAVVDYTKFEQARARAQDALDAAALGLQPTIYERNVSEATLGQQAQRLVVERLADSDVEATIESVQIDKTEGSLKLSARITVPTAFVLLVGVSELDAVVAARATRRKRNIEVMFVLDQSNSMNQSSRMQNLVAATKCAVNILFSNACNDGSLNGANENVRAGVVPFTMLVNIGAGNANASWIDRTGASDIANDNFDDDDDESSPFTGSFDRIALFDEINNVRWGGCVEARRSPYDTDDTEPSTSNPATLFVPLFAPDEPTGFNNSYVADAPSSCDRTGTCTFTETRTNCNNAGTSCSGSTTYSSLFIGTDDPPPSCTCPTSGAYTQTLTGPNKNKIRTRTWVCPFSYSPAGLSARELQERICKYTNSTASGVSTVSARGPNSDCPANAITPLSDRKSTVISSINSMASQGGTNIHAGTIWGFHALSPTQPFTEGLPYAENVSKVMIIMTDGENTAYQTNNMNGSSYYSFYGYPWNERMGNMSSTDAALETEMDTRTVTTCRNAKDAGIQIYTVGLGTEQTSNPAKVQAMLRNCSSGDGYYYFPTEPRELVDVFTDIANQLSKLRLAE
jgi:Flp pilus assembly protein TadG